MRGCALVAMTTTALITSFAAAGTDTELYGPCCPLPTASDSLDQLSVRAGCDFLCPYRRPPLSAGRFGFTFRGATKSGTSLTLALLSRLFEVVGTHTEYRVHVRHPRKHLHTGPADVAGHNFTRKELVEAKQSTHGVTVVIDHTKRVAEVVQSSSNSKHRTPLLPVTPGGPLSAVVMPVRDPRDRAVSWWFHSHQAAKEGIPAGDHWVDGYVKAGMMQEAAVVFNRQHINGVFAVTYDMLCNNKTRFLTSVLTWAGFPTTLVDTLTPRLQQVDDEWSRPVNRPVKQQSLSQLQAAASAKDAATHLRAAALHSFLDNMEAADADRVTRLMCAVSPFHYHLFKMPGDGACAAHTQTGHVPASSGWVRIRN